MVALLGSATPCWSAAAQCVLQWISRPEIRWRSQWSKRCTAIIPQQQNEETLCHGFAFAFAIKSRSKCFLASISKRAPLPLHAAANMRRARASARRGLVLPLRGARTSIAGKSVAPVEGNAPYHCVAMGALSTRSTELHVNRQRGSRESPKRAARPARRSGDLFCSHPSVYSTANVACYTYAVCSSLPLGVRTTWGHGREGCPPQRYAAQPRGAGL